MATGSDSPRIEAGRDHQFGELALLVRGDHVIGQHAFQEVEVGVEPRVARGVSG
ncbi:MAG: hypothetical protein JWP64_248 [Pseudonocardia sp.]|jgi:hypothetical protein|uniref:hypothetical protein n=1 Tax=Pseudonocardia sp. TaxID=60912 RepID=UPI002624F1EF|nr:hypothetical protein [Pseudonocardia sp.]MCU1625299.1 hypothetical protein [Pseudonocardia sp.]MDT7703996.1 hypothetical protein [Pseudonocardiales bacterium]